MKLRAGAIALAVALSGCPKDAPLEPDESDPLIKKLKAEDERLKHAPRQPTAPAPPPAQAQLARAVVEAAPPLALAPVSTVAVHTHTANFAVKALEQSQQVKGPRAAVSTPDAFLKVTLTAISTEPTLVPVAQASVISGDRSFGLARDAQIVGQGSALSLTVTPEEEVTLVLFFELPQDAVRKGLTLVLPMKDGAINLALQ